MRKSKEMIQMIKMVAQKSGAVEAIAMNGSRANRMVPGDRFQDYDIVYFIKDESMQELLENRKWIDAFGDRLILQTPSDFQPGSLDYSQRFNFLMLFTDGNRIDLGLCPLSKINDWHKEDPLSVILYDPHHLLPQDLSVTDQVYWSAKPDEQTFKNCCNEFWWVSTYVVKGICRQEFLYAAEHFTGICYQELLKLMSWIAAERNRYKINLGKSFKYLPSYLKPEERESLTELLDLSSYENMSAALINMQTMFDQYAGMYADICNYSYNSEEACNVIEYTNQNLTTKQK